MNLLITDTSPRLTAFVAKSFAEASEFITVDPLKLQQNVEFILNKQDSEGWFQEDGSTHNTYLQVEP